MLKWILYGTCWVVLLASVLALRETGIHLHNIDSNGDNDSPKNGEESGLKLPNEVQRAVCTVNAGEVKASAEAVTSTTLQGVCGSNEMQQAFHTLENKLYGELHEIKELLLKLLKIQKQSKSSADSIAPSVSTTEKLFATEPSTVKKIKLEHIALTRNPEHISKLLSLKQLQNGPEREDEVNRFNNTMLANQNTKLFTYYWKLENFMEYIMNGSTVTIDSPIFSIKGKTLQLKCTFQYLHRDMIHFRLALARPSHNLKDGMVNNIVLDMGGQQMKQLQWTDNIPFKHKISLLDQKQSYQRSQDLSSQELAKLDMGFSIPNSAIIGSNYIWHNSLLIQTILYL